MRSPDRRLGQSLKGRQSPQDVPPPPPLYSSELGPVDSCEILLPPAGQLRVRRIISRSRTIPTGKYPSVKLGRWTHWESPVECDGHRLVDVCPAVSSFGEQPLTINFAVGSLRHQHIPDLILRREGHRPALIEFKSDDDEKLEEARQRAFLLTPCLRAQGYEYYLVVGSSLARGAYLENATWLRKHAGKPLPIELYETARAAIEPAGSMTAAEFLSALDSPQLGMWSLSRLVLAGRIGFSMKDPFHSEQQLRWFPSNATSVGLTWLQAAFNATL